MSERATVVLGLNAAIVAVTDDEPRLLTVARPAAEVGLPFGPLDPAGHRTLERGLRSWVRDQTGLELGYVEQLYTFGDRFREPGEVTRGLRSVSVAYLALVREAAPSIAGAAWRGFYEFLPWEDWRRGRPPLIEREIAPALTAWARGPGGRPRLDRVELTFGLRGAPWDSERVLERYELIYEAGLVAESWREQGDPSGPNLGISMALDHRRILATALGRLRGKLRYRPVVFELLPETFTLLQLQRLVEALAGVDLHKQNFRRLVERSGLVEGSGKFASHTGGRPAELFRFRRDVLRERPAPGVGLPGARF
jgi:hypothetical protein